MINNFRTKVLGTLFIGFLIFNENTQCYAQEVTAPNSIYLELLGNGIIYSVNYDRMFCNNVSGRIGMTYFPALTSFFTTTENIFIMPVTLNYFIGDGNSKLELGAGIVYAQATLSTIFSNEEESASGIAETVIIGYRYQQSEGGFLFRIGFTPFFRFDGGLYPFGGISIGTSF